MRNIYRKIRIRYILFIKMTYIIKKLKYICIGIHMLYNNKIQIYLFFQIMPAITLSRDNVLTLPTKYHPYTIEDLTIYIYNIINGNPFVYDGYISNIVPLEGGTIIFKDIIEPNSFSFDEFQRQLAKLFFSAKTAINREYSINVSITETFGYSNVCVPICSIKIQFIPSIISKIRSVLIDYAISSLSIDLAPIESIYDISPLIESMLYKMKCEKKSNYGVETIVITRTK